MSVIKKRSGGTYALLHSVVLVPTCLSCGSELSERNKGLYHPLATRSVLFKAIGCERCQTCFRCHSMSYDDKK